MAPFFFLYWETPRSFAVRGGGGPSGSVIVTPGPGPEECQHLRWATGGLRGSPVRTCWKALRAGLSRPSSLRYRWAVSVLSGRDPAAQDWVPFQVVTPGPGPEECQHLRWATGGLRGSPVRTCWKALRAGLSRPSSLRYRWAVSVLSSRDPVAQDWAPAFPGSPARACWKALRAGALKTI